MTEMTDNNGATMPEKKPLTPAAQRALAEAVQRRAVQEEQMLAGEHDGPQGKEPTRFGDWERKGIAYDF